MTLKAVSAALLALLFAGIVACASRTASASRGPSPTASQTERSNETEASLASLTQYFKLDPAQQEKTRRLFQELAERNRKIQEGWNRGERVRWEALLGSQAIFERDFLSILTEDQKKSYADLKLKLMGGRRPRVGNPGR